MREKEFINEFSRRPNDPYWLTVNCIQTSIKSKTGVGHPVFIHFMAPINEDEPNEEINFGDFKEMPSDRELLSRDEDELYAQKQCLKLSYYV